MPKFAVLPRKTDALNDFILLVEESELCAETEVAHTEEADLLEHVFAGQLHRERIRRQEVLECEWRYLHNVSDVQAVDPLVLIQIAEDVFHIRVTNIEVKVSRANPGIGLFLSHLNYSFLVEPLAEAVVAALKRPRQRDALFLGLAFIFNGDSLKNRLKNR